jgi:hypothetical protein
MTTKNFTTGVHSTFPVGTTVAVHPPVDGGRLDSPPLTSPVTSAAVTAGGLTFTGLTDDTDYMAYAMVSGKHRYVRFRAKGSHPDPTTWKDLVASRRAAAGTS